MKKKTRARKNNKRSASGKISFAEIVFLCLATFVLLAFAFSGRDVASSEPIIPEESVIKPMGVVPLIERTIEAGNKYYSWLNKAARTVKYKFIAASGLVIPIDIDSISPELREQLEGLSESGRKIEGGFTIQVPHGLDIAINNKTGRMPEPIELNEKNYPFLQPWIRVTETGDVQLQFDGLRAKRNFERGILTLKNGAKREIKKDPDALAAIIVGWAKYFSCGFGLDGRTRSIAGEAVTDAVLKGKRQEFMDKLANVTNDSRLASVIMEQAETELTGMSLADLRRSGFGEAKKEKELFTHKLAERSSIAAKPVEPVSAQIPSTGTLVPESAPSPITDTAGMMKNVMMVKGLIETAKAGLAEDLASEYAEMIAGDAPGTIGRAEAIAFLLKETGILWEGIGVIIDAREKGFSPAKTADIISRIKAVSPLKPFILVEDQSTLSDLIIMEVPLEKIILAAGTGEVMPRIKEHMKRYGINIGPSEISLIVPAGKRSENLIKRHYSDPAALESQCCNMVIADNGALPDKQYERLFFTAAISVAARAVLKQKPAIFIIDKSGVKTVKRLNIETLEMLNIIKVTPQTWERLSAL